MEFFEKRIYLSLSIVHEHNDETAKFIVTQFSLVKVDALNILRTSPKQEFYLNYFHSKTFIFNVIRLTSKPVGKS